MAWHYFVPFLWLSNIPLCICVTSSVSIPLLTDTEFPFMSYLFVNSATVNPGVHVSFQTIVFSGPVAGSETASSYVISILSLKEDY